LRGLTTRRASPRANQAPPPFTLAQLRAAVPPHCFKRSLLRSTAYLAADCAGAAALYLGVRAADALPLPPAARLLLWTLYVLAQGAVCTGIWVVAHECGHGAFSDVRAHRTCPRARENRTLGSSQAPTSCLTAPLSLSVCARAVPGGE
jgi:hypothetical protein